MTKRIEYWITDSIDPNLTGRYERYRLLSEIYKAERRRAARMKYVSAFDVIVTVTIDSAHVGACFGRAIPAYCGGELFDAYVLSDWRRGGWLDALVDHTMKVLHGMGADAFVAYLNPEALDRQHLVDAYRRAAGPTEERYPLVVRPDDDGACNSTHCDSSP